MNTAYNPEGTRATASIWLLTEDVEAGVTTLRTPNAAPSANQVDAARFFLKILTRPPDSLWDFTDANLDTSLSRLVTAHAMSSTDRTNISDLSKNRITRAVELGLGRVSAVDVAAARAL